MACSHGIGHAQNENTVNVFEKLNFLNPKAKYRMMDEVVVFIFIDRIQYDTYYREFKI